MILVALATLIPGLAAVVTALLLIGVLVVLAVGLEIMEYMVAAGVVTLVGDMVTLVAVIT